MAKYCHKCGTQLADDALFCPSCGEAVTAEPQPEQAPQQTPPQSAPGYQQTPPQSNPGYQQTPPQGNPGYQQTPPQGNPGYQQTPPQSNPGYQQTPPQGNPGYQQYAPHQSSFMPDHTAQYHPQDAANNKAMGILSYIGFLVFIPFFAEKRSPWVRFHAVQGMYLLICNVVLSIISLCIGFIRVPQKMFGITYAYHTPIIVTIIQWIIVLISLAYEILGIVFAAMGKAKELPLIGKLTKLGWFK